MAPADPAHFGILGVLVGHFVGLVVPAGWTDSLCTSEHGYHVVAVAGGTVTGLMTVVVQFLGAGHDYRKDVAVWFRSVFWLRPDVALMGSAPVTFQLHALLGFVLIGLWPFTRLVHVFSAPVGYLARPYVVYRTRDVVGAARAPRRGWERVDT